MKKFIEAQYYKPKMPSNMPKNSKLNEKNFKLKSFFFGVIEGENHLYYVSLLKTNP
jgi:hypothetical protein